MFCLVLGREGFTPFTDYLDHTSSLSGWYLGSRSDLLGEVAEVVAIVAVGGLLRARPCKMA